MIMFICSIGAAVLMIIGIKYGADWLHDKRTYRMISDTRHLAEINKMGRTTPERAESEQDDVNKISEEEQRKRNRVCTRLRRSIRLFCKERQGVRLGYGFHSGIKRGRNPRLQGSRSA